MSASKGWMMQNLRLSLMLILSFFKKSWMRKFRRSIYLRRSLDKYPISNIFIHFYLLMISFTVFSLKTWLAMSVLLTN
uniref:Uncharacterized protein n=1 Tax=Nelumbo nucifera TaxID=4432 RepID=A0A822ZQK5_NELNU|nr:TPA_asm: hypothetical protein HUJ06_004021 [Nelumbo nucifera]